MKMVFLNADLFDTLERLTKEGRQPYAAHCIASDFGMMGGIAKQFVDRMNMRDKLNALADKQHWKRVPNPYGNYGDARQGIMYKAILVDNVYNLITKQWTYERPDYDGLVSALDSLKAEMVKNGHNVLVIPKLGCGIDGLSWNVVRRLITATFQNTNIAIFATVPGETGAMAYGQLWKEIFGDDYKGYQGEPLPGKSH